jgi:transketolase
VTEDKQDIVKKVDSLKEISRVIRKDILNMVMKAGEGHIASAFSFVDILSVLYFHTMNVDPEEPAWEERDRFILSKGHGCSALYSVLARRGFFSPDDLNTIGERDTIFGGHPDKYKVPGVEVSTGSLGHGLSIGIGMSLAAKRDKKDYNVYVLLGDGECQEGSVWEAAMFAPAYGLDNMIAIVDFNGLQAIGETDDIITLKPFAKKWESFGWAVKEINGHDYNEIMDAMSQFPFSEGKPSVIIANTVKGKGVSFMENQIMWHARATTEEEYKQALMEIDHSF